MCSDRQGGRSIQERLEEEQLRLSFRQIPFVVVVPLISGALLSMLHRDVVDLWMLNTWMGMVILGTCVAAGILLLKYRKTVVISSAGLWMRRLIFVAIFSSLMWGLGSVLLFTPDSSGHVGLIMLWMYIPAATGSMIAVASRPLFYSIMIPMLFPLTVMLVVEGDELFLLLAIATVIYMGCLVYFHSHIHRMLVDSIQLRFEKDDLIEEVMRRKEEADHANQAKSRFLAAASHDLRQPLHAQSLFIAELKCRLEDSENLKIIGHLESSVESMGGLFNSLLDISRIDAAKVKCNVQDIQVSVLLNRLKSEFSGQAAHKDLELRVVECKHIVRSDPALLICILQNLLTNAIHYTGNGTVMLCCRRSGDGIRIEVRDSGPGIEADKHDEIFQEFIQLGNRERDRRKGLGLGLAIVARLGKLLGHMIGIRSVPGRGSVFSVTVPVSAVETGSVMAAGTTHDDLPQLTGVRVLVIENESDIRDGMRGLLGRWGCEVLDSSDLSVASDLLIEFAFVPDVILSDYRLPGLNTGIDTINGIRRHLSMPVPGILVTGDIAAEIYIEADANDVSVLHKPVVPDELRLLIGECVTATG